MTLLFLAVYTINGLVSGDWEPSNGWLLASVISVGVDCID